MTPIPAKIHVLAPLFWLLSSAAVSAGRAPLTEFDGATKALALAAEVGAATYAPLELRYAEELLEQARQAAASGAERDARQHLEQSRVNSDLAVAKSRLGKVREEVQVQAASNANLRHELGLPEPEPQQ